MTKTHSTLAGLFLAAVVLAVLLPLGPAAAQDKGERTPSVRITTPKNGQVVKKQKIEVTVAIKDFKLDKKAIGKAAVPGRGHWHLILDGKDLGPQQKPTAKVKQIAAGEHTFEASLRNNDHSLLAPPVSDSVKVTIAPENKGSKKK